MAKHKQSKASPSFYTRLYRTKLTTTKLFPRAKMHCELHKDSLIPFRELHRLCYVQGKNLLFVGAFKARCLKIHVSVKRVFQKNILTIYLSYKLKYSSKYIPILLDLKVIKY